ncbi:Vacuolar protein sorting-associated protein 8 [Dinochytrium kinnereticum]|nr:Vacuolar protein sorting-associated protein 8 [Dinochytrium kinnereticum]
MALSSYEKDSMDIGSLTSLVRLCIETCVSVHREDILFNDIFERFSELGLEQLFFETLEPFILEDRITMLDNPVMLQSIITIYKQHLWLERIEQIVLHLDPFSLDLHGIIGLCKEYGLMSALIYVFNRAVQDFVSPLIELLKMIESALKGHSVDVVGSIPLQSRCYTLFMYLAYILTGKAFPIGVLSKRESIRAKTDIYNFLFSSNHIPWPPEENRKDPVEIGNTPLPYVRVLLQYDSKEFLKVLSLAFEDASLDGEIRVRDASASEGRVRFADEHTEFSRQMIVEALLSASVSTEISSQPGTVLALNIFMAKIFVKYRRSISFEKELLNSITEALIESDDAESLTERQITLCGLFSDYCPSHVDIMSEEFMQRCEKRGLWRVCEFLYTRAEQFGNVLKCYLQDESRNHESFRCLRTLMANEALTYAQLWDLKQFFFASITAFVELDYRETAALIIDLMPGDINELTGKLEDQPPLLFKFLSGLLDDVKDHRSRALASSIADDEGAAPIRRFPNRMYERYIDLMCAYQASSVVGYLKFLSEHLEGDPYPIDKILELCEKSQNYPAALWLYERMGDFTGALTLVSKLLKEYFSQIDIEVSDDDLSEDDDDLKKTRVKASLSLIKATFETGVNLCRRSSGKVSSEDRTTLWFQLLDVILDFQLQINSKFAAVSPSLGYPKTPSPIRGRPSLVSGRDPSPSRESTIPLIVVHSVKAITEKLLEDLVGQVNAPSILGRILQATQSRAKFGEHKDTIFCMLDSHSYEREQLQAVTRTQGQDLHELMVKARRVRMRGMRPDRGHCFICKRALHIDAFTLSDLKDHIVLFQCRHTFHRTCLIERLSIEQRVSTGPWKKVEPSIENGIAWCIFCDSQAPLRSTIRKKLVIGGTPQTKGKDAEVDYTNPTDVDESNGLSRDMDAIDRLYAHYQKLPIGVTIYAALRPSNLIDTDRIEMNDNVDDTIQLDSRDSLGSFGSQGDASATRLIPAPVLKLLHLHNPAQPRAHAPPSFDARAFDGEHDLDTALAQLVSFAVKLQMMLSSRQIQPQIKKEGDLLTIILIKPTSADYAVALVVFVVGTAFLSVTYAENWVRVLTILSFALISYQMIDDTFVTEIDRRKAGSGMGSNRASVTKSKLGRISWKRVAVADELVRAVLVEDDITKKSKGWALEMEFLSSAGPTGLVGGGGLGGYMRIRTAETLVLGDTNKEKLVAVAKEIHEFLGLKDNPFAEGGEGFEERISKRGDQRREGKAQQAAGKGSATKVSKKKK